MNTTTYATDHLTLTIDHDRHDYHLQVGDSITTDKHLSVALARVAVVAAHHCRAHWHLSKVYWRLPELHRTPELQQVDLHHERVWRNLCDLLHRLLPGWSLNDILYRTHDLRVGLDCEVWEHLGHYQSLIELVADISKLLGCEPPPLDELGTTETQPTNPTTINDY
jgi:hypothetical protein